MRFAVSRVTGIKAAIVLAASMATAVIIFVTSYRLFGFDLVSRGRQLDLPIGWAGVLWLTLPNLILAVFVRRWWIKQDGSESKTANRPSMLPWTAAYLVMTLALLSYYFLTFTAVLQP